MSIANKSALSLPFNSVSYSAKSIFVCWQYFSTTLISWYAPPPLDFSCSQSAKKLLTRFLNCTACSGRCALRRKNNTTVFVPVLPKVWLPNSTILKKSKCCNNISRVAMWILSLLLRIELGTITPITLSGASSCCARSKKKHWILLLLGLFTKLNNLNFSRSTSSMVCKKSSTANGGFATNTSKLSGLIFSWEIKASASIILTSLRPYINDATLDTLAKRSSFSMP